MPHSSGQEGQGQRSLCSRLAIETEHSGLADAKHAGPVWVRTSIVHRYGTPERPVEPRRVTSCQKKIPTETCRNPIWPDRPRRALTDHSTVPYQCTIDIRTHTGPYGTLKNPIG